MAMREVERRPYVLALREFAGKHNVALADAAAALAAPGRRRHSLSNAAPQHDQSPRRSGPSIVRGRTVEVLRRPSAVELGRCDKLSALPFLKSSVGLSASRSLRDANSIAELFGWPCDALPAAIFPRGE